MPPIDLRRLARSAAFTLAAAAAFVVPPLATGIADAWHEIFVLGEFNEKFGQQGSFDLSVSMQTAFWAFMGVTFSITRWVLSVATRSSPPFSRVFLLSLLLGVVASALVLTNTLLRQLPWCAPGPVGAVLVHLVAGRLAKSSSSTA